MGFCQVSLKGSQFIDIFKNSFVQMCYVNEKYKKKRQLQTEQCFACITLHNKVIKTVSKSPLVPFILKRVTPDISPPKQLIRSLLTHVPLEGNLIKAPVASG